MSLLLLPERVKHLRSPWRVQFRETALPSAPPFVPLMISHHTETICAAADGMTAIGAVKPGTVASPHAEDLAMTVRILSDR